MLSWLHSWGLVALGTGLVFLVSLLRNTLGMTRKLVQTWGPVKVRVSHYSQVSDSSSNSKRCSSSGVRCRLPFSRPSHVYSYPFSPYGLCPVGQWEKWPETGREETQTSTCSRDQAAASPSPSGAARRAGVASGCQLCVCSHSASLRLCIQTESTVGRCSKPPCC